MTTNRMILTISVVLSCALSASVTSVADPPAHVLVRAEYRAGGTCDDCFGWRVTISDDGIVNQQVKTVPGWNSPDEWVDRSTPNLTRRQIQRLILTLEKNRFQELAAEYSASYPIDERTERVVTDQGTVVIEARVGEELKRVEIYGPEDVAGIYHSDHAHPAREAGRRFCRVWAEILAMVQPPNFWQKAKVYR